jgi:xanthine dehydrogenase FAD-binding subunit
VRVVAGGTDVTVYLKDGALKEELLMDISKLRALGRIRDGGPFLAIGAGATFSQIATDSRVRKWAPLLAEAALEVGSAQIRNLATMAGNICNASPAADSLPPLFVHGSSVVLSSVDGQRELPIADFVLGPRKTARRPSELLTEVRIPKMKPGTLFFFKKLGLRSSQAISVVSIAVTLHGKEAKIALGAVAPVVVFASKAEEFILKFGLDKGNLEEVCFLVGEAASPISDLRGTAEYRRGAVASVAYEGFHEILHPGGPRT